MSLRNGNLRLSAAGWRMAEPDNPMHWVARVAALPRAGRARLAWYREDPDGGAYRERPSPEPWEEDRAALEPMRPPPRVPEDGALRLAPEAWALLHAEAASPGLRLVGRAVEDPDGTVAAKRKRGSRAVYTVALAGGGREQMAFHEVLRRLRRA